MEVERRAGEVYRLIRITYPNHNQDVFLYRFGETRKSFSEGEERMAHTSTRSRDSEIARGLPDAPRAVESWSDLAPKAVFGHVGAISATFRAFPAF